MFKDGVLKIKSEEASKVKDWLNQGGVHVWKSVDCATPHKIAITQADDGAVPPDVYLYSLPVKITDAAKVMVVDREEACDPIYIVIERGPRHMDNLTLPSITEIDEAIEKAGEDAYYELDVKASGERIARIYRPIKETPLLEYVRDTTTSATTSSSSATASSS